MPEYEQPAGADMDEKTVSKIVSNMKRDHQRRDLREGVRSSMFYRRDDNMEHTGQHVSKPYDEGEMIIRSSTGTLTRMADHYASRASANPAVLQVQTVQDWGKDTSERQKQNASKIEAFLNGQSYACGNRRNQKLVSFEQARCGVGFYLTYEYAHGFGLPDRLYFEEEQGDDAVAIGEKTAERADKWIRRRTDSAKSRAMDDQPLWIEEVVQWSTVYLRRDRAGIKYAAIVESIPSDNCGPYSDMAKSAADTWGEPEMEKTGILKSGGKVIAGIGVGGSKTDSADHFTLTRFFTREEIYYEISSGSDEGMIVFHTKHDYNEVPLYPAAWRETASNRPEEMYEGPLEAAYGLVPGVNQLETLLSNVAVYNATPRYVIEKPDGSLAVDPVTGQPITVTSEPGVGLDPEHVAVIHGGTLKPLVATETDVLYQMLVYKAGQLQADLPSDAMTGAGATDGPAWTTRLMQSAANVPVVSAVENNAGAVLQMNRMRVRVEKQRGGTYYSQTEPVTGGESKGQRSMVEVTAEELTTNLFVKQDPIAMDERITMMQVGREMWMNGEIDDREYFEYWYGANDPDDMIKRRDRQAVLTRSRPHIYTQVTQTVLQGALPIIAEVVPRTASESADNILDAGAAAGSVADAAGIRQASVGMSDTQPALPAEGNPAALGGVMGAG